MRVLCLVMLVVVVMVTTGRAYAQTPIAPTNEEALKHLSQGNKLYSVRSFDEAAAEYRAGAMIQIAPIFDYNLGQCYRQLGKYRDAIWHYDRFLKSGAGSEQQVSSAQKFITQMKAELEQKAKSEPPTDAANASTQQQPSEKQPPVEDKAEYWYNDRLGWGLAGGGVVAGVVATVLFVQSSDLHTEGDAAPTADEARALHEKADTRAVLGGIVGVVGAGLLITGGIKLAIHSDPSSTQTAWGVGVSSQGAFVWGRF